jgi:hypothetical protein
MVLMYSLRDGKKCADNLSSANEASAADVTNKRSNGRAPCGALSVLRRGLFYGRMAMIASNSASVRP